MTKLVYKLAKSMQGMILRECQYIYVITDVDGSTLAGVKIDTEVDDPYPIDLEYSVDIEDLNLSELTVITPDELKTEVNKLPETLLNVILS